MAARGAQIELLLNGILDSNGEPLAAGKVYTYEAGTTTDQAVYTDIGLTSAAANPVVLDSNGRYQAYAAGSYKFIIKDSDDNTLYTFDNLFFGEDSNLIAWGGTASGSADTITLGLDNPLTAYAAGQRVAFIASANNTGAATLNIDGLGAKDIKRPFSGSNCEAGDILNGKLVEVIYDGTQFRLWGRADIEVIDYSSDLALGAVGGGSFSASNVEFAYYSDHGDAMFYSFRVTFTVSGTVTNVTVSTPLTVYINNQGAVASCMNGVNEHIPSGLITTAEVISFDGGVSNWGGDSSISFSGWYI